jgi:NADH-quinone oxidoreductase subunit C
MAKLENTTIVASLQAKFADKVQVEGEPHGLLTILVKPEDILTVLEYLKTDESLSFQFLTDITAVHYPELDKPFCVVYHLHSWANRSRIRVKAFVDGKQPAIASATALWNGANWMERETYDFFGIRFLGHPDLRRILNVDDMEAFPMRKEYPLEDPNRVDKKDYFFGR